MSSSERIVYCGTDETYLTFRERNLQILTCVMTTSPKREDSSYKFNHHEGDKRVIDEAKKRWLGKERRVGEEVRFALIIDGEEEHRASMGNGENFAMAFPALLEDYLDRKSTRLNSSHSS